MKIKILPAPINTTPGDFQGNFQKIIGKIDEAILKSCDMVVFPELSIPGYLSCDMMFKKSYVKKNITILHDIMEKSIECPSLYIVVGYIDKNTTGVGKPFKNRLAVINDGGIIGVYDKHLLPFFDVFDEARYYEPGSDHLVLTIKDTKFGFTICEDIWNDKNQDDYNYKHNPIQYYKNIGVNTIVNISSSPYVKDKLTKKITMLNKISKSNKVNIVYVNQYGGQDELVFNGDCYLIKHNSVTDSQYYFENNNKLPFDCFILDKFNGGFIQKQQQPKPDHLLFDMLVLGLRDYITKTGFKRVVLGSSGGIDSAVVLALACEAIGPENVYAVMMPSIYSSGDSVNDAKKLHEAFGCNEFEVPIEHMPLLENINCNFNSNEMENYNQVADENIQARLRGLIIMHYSNASGAMALTTGNKTENAVGYCTLYGDTNGGFNPIKDLYKTEVFNIARYFNNKYRKEMIPLNIINKPPTAELKPDQTDEASLMPYELLDILVQEYIESYIDNFDMFLKKHRQLVLKHFDDIEKASSEYSRIIRLIDLAEYKRRQTAPGVKVSSVAFGTGRRLPIVSKKGN